MSTLFRDFVSRLGVILADPRVAEIYPELGDAGEQARITARLAALSPNLVRVLGYDDIESFAGAFYRDPSRRLLLYPNNRATSTTYYLGERVLNSTPIRVYECITPGDSAGLGSPGPSGTAADITDGSVHWRYVADEGESSVTFAPTSFGAAVRFHNWNLSSNLGGAATTGDTPPTGPFYRTGGGIVETRTDLDVTDDAIGKWEGPLTWAGTQFASSRVQLPAAAKFRFRYVRKSGTPTDWQFSGLTLFVELL